MFAWPDRTNSLNCGLVKSSADWTAVALTPAEKFGNSSENEDGANGTDSNSEPNIHSALSFSCTPRHPREDENAQAHC